MDHQVPVHVAVVGHISRKDMAENLAESLGAELFIDNLTLGATFGHLRALNWAANKEGHLIVLEDDAQPVNGFLKLAAEWIREHPDELTSFYLGTGKPPQYQARIEQALADNPPHITLDMLIHAVAYTLPCETIPKLTLPSKPMRMVADYGLGVAWTKLTRRPIYYTCPSLVDHADGPSLEAGVGRALPPRHAWKLHEGL